MRIPELNINTEALIPGSVYFTWEEALYLHQWDRLASISDGVTQKTLESIQYFAANFLKPIREFINAPFIVHCWLRPPEYSVLVGGTSTDVHTMTNHLVDQDHLVSAIDFHPIFSTDVILDCKTFKAKLLPKLADFKIRMENNGAKGWIHLDNYPTPPLHHPFFTP